MKIATDLEFFKFPSTPHLATLGGLDVRQDKVFSEQERDEFLRIPLTIEEKIDGANLGISFDQNGNIMLQNRGKILWPPFLGQWKKLSDWLALRTDQLFETLVDRYIVFGEWCYAKHSIFYDKLPDWFLAFDIYDKWDQEFLAAQIADSMFTKMDICRVPIIALNVLIQDNFDRLIPLQSAYGAEKAEGVYFRYDNDRHLKSRAKLVDCQFIQNIDTHWAAQGLVPNQLDCSDWDMRPQKPILSSLR